MEEQLLDTEINSPTKEKKRSNTFAIILLSLLVLISFCCIAVFSMPPSLVYVLSSFGYISVFFIGLVTVVLLKGKRRWLTLFATITSSLAIYLLMYGNSSGKQMQTYGLLISIYSALFFLGILMVVLNFKNKWNEYFTN